jgi:dolichol-phosphate mannosyltransferase
VSVIIRLSVIVPTYNERENLEELLRRLDRALSGLDFEVIVVDDDSPDGTWQLAEELARTKYPWLKVIRRRGRRGLASAIIDGVRASRGHYIVVMDADLQHPPELVPQLLRIAEREGAEVVVASRYAPGGGVEGWSRLRLLMSKVATLLAYALVPESKATTDPMSGFFLVSRRFMLPCIGRVKAQGYKLLLEVLARCKPSKVVDVAYVFARRLRGRSKLGLATVVDYLLQLLRLNEYRVFKMACVGALGLLVLYLANTLLKDILGVTRLISYAVAIEVSILHNFTLNNVWTFRRRGRRGILSKLLSYHYAVAAGALTNYAVYQLLTNVVGLHDLPSILVGVAAGYLVNYMLAEHHVWS